ncbi:MAG: isoprenyl transferase [Anaerolineales bacterium]|nr:isoprenyl transferase [Anaerolineales bacterium]
MGKTGASTPAGPPPGLPTNIPGHVAIIMDGNGRWAKSRGLPRLAGHRAGVENLRRVIEGCAEFRVRYLTLYAFSTENWERPEEEVKGLLRILEEVIDRELDELHRNGVQLHHIGRLEGLSPFLRKKVQQAIEMTRGNTRLVLNIAFNYGGRDELVYALRRMIRDGVSADAVDEALVGKYLFTAGIPDPDLVIRTSGEQRTSNFLLWQSAYSEWYFPETLWPDFDKEELRKALWEYSSRERRFGGILPAAPVS